QPNASSAATSGIGRRLTRWPARPAAGNGAVGSGVGGPDGFLPHAASSAAAATTLQTPRTKSLFFKGLVTEPKYRGLAPRFQASVSPPSTTIVCPVMWRAASLQRNTMTLATSSGSATRPSTDSRSARSSTSRGSLVSSSVLTNPGATALTLTLEGPKSTAADLVSPISPALLAA